MILHWIKQGMVIPLDPTLLLIPGSWLYIPVGLMWFHFHGISKKHQKTYRRVKWKIHHESRSCSERETWSVFHGFPPSFRRFSLGYLLVSPIPIEPQKTISIKTPPLLPSAWLPPPERAHPPKWQVSTRKKTTGKRRMSPGKSGNYDGFIHEKHGNTAGLKLPNLSRVKFGIQPTRHGGFSSKKKRSSREPPKGAPRFPAGITGSAVFFPAPKIFQMEVCTKKPMVNQQFHPYPTSKKKGCCQQTMGDSTNEVLFWLRILGVRGNPEARHSLGKHVLGHFNHLGA